MPRYTLDLAAMRNNARQNPGNAGLNSALASILNGLDRRAQNQAAMKDRASQRAFEITKFLSEDADRHQRIALDKQRLDDEDSFKAKDLAEHTRHDQQEEDDHWKSDMLHEMDKQDEDDRASNAEVEKETHDSADEAERQRHDQVEEERQSKSSKTEPFNPYTTDKTWDPDTMTYKETRRLKTADEVRQEKQVRALWDGQPDTAPKAPAGAPASGLPSDVPGGASPSLPAAAPAAPVAPPVTRPQPLALPTLPNDEEQPAGGFAPAQSEAEGNAAVMKKIPDFADQYAATKGMWQGDELQKLRMATAAGDHEGVQYLLDLAKSRDPDFQGKAPAVPDHWAAARQAAGEPDEDAPPPDTGPDEGPAVR